MDFLQELKWRGLVKDCTDFEGLQEKLKGKVTAYCGFDPTADSLHIGHMQQIMLLRRYQQQGHRPIALCGGATGMIGDPRPTSERRLITLDEVAHNVECIKTQLGKFIDFDDDKALLLNNHDWLGELTLLDFLRIYGKHFNVNYMIAKDTISSRLATGISFTEFTYTILQAADWLHLYDKYDCTLQIGGSDQWGNLVSGSDLIRKINGDKAKVFGITSPLITKADGSKFGKSEGKNIWLDPNKTSAYEFYQFWVNVSDVEILPLLKRLSMQSVDEIKLLEQSIIDEPHLRKAQISLAQELTILVHGQTGLDTAVKITQTLFKGDINDLSFEEIKIGLSDMPTTHIDSETTLTDVLLLSKISSSKRDARELIKGNSVAVNGVKITDSEFVVSKNDAYNNEMTIIKKGKKNYFVIKFN